MRGYPRPGHPCREGGSIALSDVDTGTQHPVNIIVFFYSMGVQAAPSDYVNYAVEGFKDCIIEQIEEPAAFDLSAAALCATDMYPEDHYRLRGVAVAPGCNHNLPLAHQIGEASPGGRILVGGSLLRDSERPHLGSDACVTTIMLLPEAMHL